MPAGWVAGAAALATAAGGYMQSQSAADAAQAQADAYNNQSGLQYARAQEAAGKVPEFKPVTVTSNFGTPNYTYDANGRLTGVSSTAAPWLSNLQAQGQGLAGQYMSAQQQAAQNQQLLGLSNQAYGTGQTVYGLAGQAANQAQGLYGVGQQQYNIAQGLAPNAQQFNATGQALQGTGADIYAKAAQALPTSYDTTQATQDYYDRMQQLVAPQREQQLAKTRQSLFNTGRQGLATGATQAGGMLATNPEMAAYYNAIAQQDLSLANQSEQQALANLQTQTNMGQGLYNTGLQQYQAGLNYGQSGVNTAGAMSNILGQGATTTQAGTGQLTSAGNLYNQGTGLFTQGGNLANQYYTNLTASQAPLTNQLSQLTGMESMQYQPVTQGMQYGGTVNTQANNIAQAYMNAAGAGNTAAMQAIQSQYTADASNPWAAMLIGGGQALGKSAGSFGGGSSGSSADLGGLSSSGMQYAGGINTGASGSGGGFFTPTYSSGMLQKFGQ
jgi:YD repeat-containing protein